MQKIIPHLWFNKEAKKAAEFYTTLLPNSRVDNISTIYDTPSGDCDTVTFTMNGFTFMAISAGPFFKITPAVSFMINFDPAQDADAQKRIDEVWNKLSEGGTALMPIDKYPFSERYGWIQDKFGVSWQLMLTNPAGEPRPPIIPSVMFIGSNAGKAEEATEFYLSVFRNAKRGTIARYAKGASPHDAEGTIMFTDFMIENQWFAAMDSGYPHQFPFGGEGISFIVHCDNQTEIDYYWEKLSAVPEAEQCGWLKDKYGLSWQVTPAIMHKMMQTGTPEQINRVTQAFLRMKKFDIAKLKNAFDGK